MPAVMTQEESKLVSETIFADLQSRDFNRVKAAEDKINDFTRTKMREDGIFRKIMPPIPITNGELDRSLVDEKPIKIIDREPESPASISVPFATLPDNIYIKGDRYPIQFDRILTPKFTKDADELRTWVMDIRQVLSDNSIKDMLAEEDGKWLRAHNSAILGPGLVVPTSGTVQYEVISGMITRETLCDSLKIMPNTPSNLEVHTGLVNNITIKEMMKFTFNEVGGGDFSSDIMANGWTRTKMLGVEWLVTIKKGLVSTNTCYYYADQKFIGKSFELEPCTLFVKREAFFLEFFAYETLGAGIGWTSGLARVDWE